MASHVGIKLSPLCIKVAIFTPCQGFVLRLNDYSLYFSSLNFICLYLSDIDDCADQPCLNGGSCIDSVNDYTCRCADGYSGKNCSIGKRVFVIPQTLLSSQLNISFYGESNQESFKSRKTCCLLPFTNMLQFHRHIIGLFFTLGNSNKWKQSSFMDAHISSLLNLVPYICLCFSQILTIVLSSLVSMEELVSTG